MSEAVAQLEAIRAMVEQAKSVPMSASCIVNRAETTAALDRVLGAVRAEADAARRQSGADALADAHAHADQILNDAKAEAARLVTESEVLTRAQAQADEVTRVAAEQVSELRREADVYVDQRLAELEASMAKTMSQLKTMRARLSERSSLDERSALEGA